MAQRKNTTANRSDALRNKERILEAAARLLERSPSSTLAEIAAAAGVSRSTLHRHFAGRKELLAAVRSRPAGGGQPPVDAVLPPGRLGRDRPVPLDAIHVFDVVPPPLLPEQLVAEAQRIAGVPVALYVIDIDGSHLLRVSGADRLGDRLEAPLAIGPELDADGLAQLRAKLGLPGAEVVPLWLRGRATGVMIAFGRPKRPLTEIARQASAAMTLADRYTDVLARTQRRKQPKAAAEIQQSLLPPRIIRVSGGEVAGSAEMETLIEPSLSAITRSVLESKAMSARRRLVISAVTRTTPYRESPCSRPNRYVGMPCPRRRPSTTRETPYSLRIDT